MLTLLSGKRILCVLLFLLTAALLHAQFDSGTVLGTVHDPSGAPVPNASVTLEDVKTGVVFQIKTDANGNYEFVNERVGTYRVRVVASGFSTATSADFELAVNARQRVDMSLNIGQASQNITVTDAVAQLETDNSSRGQVINPQQIIELPLNGRAYADLVLLSPGVAKSPLQVQNSDSSRDASFNVNGQRSELNNFLLDGVDNNSYGTSNQGFSNQVIQANPDSLAEFKVETDNYSAEFGRATGAVVNASLKSGTNQFHGELWEFFRNTDLNATGFFKPVTGGKLPFNQNQFGAALGGPVVKDKMFFFADYEGFRRVQHPVQFATIPTAAMIQGNFSSFGISIKNPLTGAIYSNGIIPASAFSPLASAVLSELPAANLPGNSNNFQSAPSDTTNNDKGDIRFDYFINPKFSLLARYSQSDTSIFSPPNIPGPAGGNANGNVYIRNKQGVLGGTWTVSSTSVLDVRAGVDYTEGGKNPTNLGDPNSVYNFPNLPTDPSVAGGLFSVGLAGGLSQLGRQSSNPQYQNPLVIDPKANFTKILGRHSLKVGFEYQTIDTAVSDFHPQYGTENFAGFFSNPGLSSLSGLQQQIFSVADFIIGAPSHYELDNNPVAHLRQRMYFGYLQDDWKFNQRLTLNLGMRYEFATPQYERDNKLSNFNPVAVSLITASSGSLYNRSLVHPDPHNWAPRLGLAFQATPKTVLRAGYGISYVQFNRLGGENLLAYNGPFVVDEAIDQTPAQGVCASANTAAGACFRTSAQGFPANFATPATFNTAVSQVRYIPGSNRTPYVQSWHFTIQQELAKNLLLDVGYVGNHSVGLIILADANQSRPNLLGQNLSVQARRPFPTFNTIEESFSAGFSSYNGLQVKLEKRYSGGLYLLNSFTWSKAIDNAPGHLENYNGDNSRINLYNMASERGISSYDQPLNNTTSVLYDLPFGHGRHFDIQNRPLNFIAGGWAIDLISSATSGLPLNVIYSPTTQAQVSPLLTPRPNLTGQPIYTSTGNPTLYLSSAAFSLPSYAQPFGNAGRNIARSSAFYQLDFGVHKNFALWSESSHLEFRAEAFNVLNKTNFGTPNTTWGSTSYGTITATFPARQIQLAMKLLF